MISNVVREHYRRSDGTTDLGEQSLWKQRHGGKPKEGNSRTGREKYVVALLIKKIKSKRNLKH
jgi:hypothetical protein